MFWFKNIMAYRLTSKIDLSKIEEALQTEKFTPCEKSDYSRFGWSEPLHDTGLLAYQASGHILLVSCKEEKNLPAYAVNRKLAERLVELEEKEQRKLKKTEKLALKDAVISEMLPHAFSKFTYTAIWIDTNKGLVLLIVQVRRKQKILWHYCGSRSAPCLLYHSPLILTSAP